MSVFIDVTELLGRPDFTGIQRVTAQICRHWPGSGLVPVSLTPEGRLGELPGGVLTAIAGCFDTSAPEAVKSLRALHRRHRRSLPGIPEQGTLLVPELFYDPPRIEFYRRMDEDELGRCRFVVYDFLPLTHPQYFPPDLGWDVIGGYFQVVRRAPRCAFISESTRQIYWRRLRRSPQAGGPVLRLGSDGLGARPATLAADRPPRFAMVGRIEPWKNHPLVLDVFEPLLREMPELRLTFLGKFGMDQAFAARVQKLARELPGFEHYPQPDDNLIRETLGRSRATISVSEAEGFGLPPVESLWWGTPVIASRGIPSLETVGSHGIHLVEPLDRGNLANAVRAFLDDGYARSKAEEARNLPLPAWQSFALQLARWCAGMEPAV